MTGSDNDSASFAHISLSSAHLEGGAVTEIVTQINSKNHIEDCDHTNENQSSSVHLNAHSHTASSHHNSDCEQSQSSTSWDAHNKKEDRPSSFRSSTKQNKQRYSPRWRDQEELSSHGQHSVNQALSEVAAFHLHEVNFKSSISCIEAQLHQENNASSSIHHEHNDSASQTSHTDSHHSSFETISAYHGDVAVKHLMIQHETRFPTAMGYAASEVSSTIYRAFCVVRSVVLSVFD